jgi:hypothetical protein
MKFVKSKLQILNAMGLRAIVMPSKQKKINDKTLFFNFIDTLAKVDYIGKLLSMESKA